MTADVTFGAARTKLARVLGITAAGQEPTGHDGADLGAYLQGAIDGLQLLRNGPWTDVLLTSSDDYEASDGERISVEGFDPVITLPTTYVDDCGVTKIMRDLSRVHVVGDGIYVYSSSLGAWNKTDELAATDPFPFAAEDTPGIIAIAATDAADEYRAELTQATVQRAEAARSNLTGRFWRGLTQSFDAGLLNTGRTWL